MWVVAGCIKKREELSNEIKVKLMLDAAKELACMQGNMLLRPDIEPDNVFVFSFNKVLT